MKKIFFKVINKELRNQVPEEKAQILNLNVTIIPFQSMINYKKNSLTQLYQFSFMAHMMEKKLITRLSGKLVCCPNKYGKHLIFKLNVNLVKILLIQRTDLVLSEKTNNE